MAALCPRGLRQFAQQVIGAVTFTANWVLMRQGSYFGGDADFKPLLHFWSLSIEEQYYLLMPALLYFAPRKYWMSLVVGTFLVSFALCIGVGIWRSSFAFYLSPCRAWELAIGSFGALVEGRRWLRSVVPALFWPAVAAVMILVVKPIGGQQPGIDALIICFSTLVIILRRHVIFDHVAFRPIAKVGDISYSLYLVHWPIFALANNMWLGEAPETLRIALIFVALLLAWLQYRFIENPIHRAPFRLSARRVGAAVTVSAVVAAIPSVAVAMGRAPERFLVERRGNTGLGQNCVSGRSFVVKPGCSTGPVPTELVWGDSYAMHLVPGIVATRGGETITQATKYMCSPLIGVTMVSRDPGSDTNRHWTQGCQDQNDSVIAYLRATPSIRTVVLSSMFRTYLNADSVRLVIRDGNGTRVADATPDIVMQGMRNTITAIRALGRRVVVVAPPPALDWDAGLCAERQLRGLPTFGPHADCFVSDAEYRRSRAAVLKLLARMPAELGVNVLSLERYMRVGTGYPATNAGRIIYITNGHLSYYGSEMVARRMDMGKMIARSAS